MNNPISHVEHEATTSKNGEYHLHYFQRGIYLEKATTTLINVFFGVVFNEIPLEFATKVNKLMNLKLEGGVK